MLSSGVKPAILGFPAGHLDRFAIGIVIYLCLKLLQYSEMRGIAGGSSMNLNWLWLYMNGNR